MTAMVSPNITRAKLFLKKFMVSAGRVVAFRKRITAIAQAKGAKRAQVSPRESKGASRAVASISGGPRLHLAAPTPSS